MRQDESKLDEQDNKANNDTSCWPW